MRILYVVHGFPPRSYTGTESYTYQLARRTARENEVGVFYLFKDPSLPIYSREKVEQDGLECRGINYNVNAHAKNFRATWDVPQVNAAFKDYLREFRPDVVHFTYLLGGLSIYQVREAKDFGAKVVVTLTDFLPLCLRGQLLDHNFDLCNGPESAYKCSNCVWMVQRIRKGILESIRLRLLKVGPVAGLAKRIIARFISRRTQAVYDALKRADLVITPTKALAEKYEHWMKLPGRTGRLGFGIDESLFKNFHRDRADKIRFGFIGQMLPHKGLHILVKAANKLPEDKNELVVFGTTNLPGSEEYVAGFENEMMHENISRRGSFPYEKIGEAFAQFDVLVVPSLWYENSPLVVLYAKRTRTPMIVSDFGGLTEFVSDGKTGFVVPPGDSSALAGAMRKFSEEPGLCNRLASNITAPMSIEEHSSAIMNFYRQLL